MAAFPVVVKNQYNSKTLPLGQTGDAVADNYGITARNAVAKLEKLWPHRAEKAGGSKTLFDKISKTIDQNLAKNPNHPQWLAFKQWRDTGKVPATLRTDLAKRALGIGYSEAARAQQHKKGFLDSFLGQLLVMGAEVAVGAWAGPWAAAAVGGGFGYVKDHSILGVIKGGIQGYAAGQIGEWGAAGWNEAATNAGLIEKGISAGGAIARGLAGSFGAGSLLNVAATGALAIAAANAAKPAKPGAPAKPVTTNDLATAGGKSLVDEQAAQQRKDDRIQGVANIAEARMARRQSLLAVGAHTGAGDPRRIGTMPKARGVIATPSGRSPVIATPRAVAA